MHRARLNLLNPDESTTVRSVCDKYGFHPSRFAADYFNMFGEYPSETLQLARLAHRLY